MHYFEKVFDILHFPFHTLYVNECFVLLDQTQYDIQSFIGVLNPVDPLLFNLLMNWKTIVVIDS